jgi:hypothetical protein
LFCIPLRFFHDVPFVVGVAKVFGSDLRLHPNAEGMIDHAFFQFSMAAE